MSTRTLLPLLLLEITACVTSARPSTVVAAPSRSADLPYCERRDFPADGKLPTLDSKQKAALWDLEVAYAEAAGACKDWKGTVSVIVHWNATGAPERVCLGRDSDERDTKQIECVLQALSRVNTPEVLRSAMHQFGMQLYPNNPIDAVVDPESYKEVLRQCRAECLDYRPCFKRIDGEVGPPN